MNDPIQFLAGAVAVTLAVAVSIHPAGGPGTITTGDIAGWGLRKMGAIEIDIPGILNSGVRGLANTAFALLAKRFEE
ncbi:MAG: hypothetical protein WC683_16155 [bacterium]